MDQLQFQPDPEDDIAALYQRLVGDDLDENARMARQAIWEAMTGALARVLEVAESFGLGAVGLDALDAELAEVARIAARGQRVSFEAGLRAGAALAGMQGPSAN